MPTTDELVELISNMKVGELNELVKALQEKFDIEATTPMFQGPMAPAAFPGAVAGEPTAAAEAAEEEEAEEEQTEFDVVLESFGDQKIKVIKEVRAVTDLGLKEAKDVVESAPVAIKEGIPKEEADNVKEALEAVGATVQIK